MTPTGRSADEMPTEMVMPVHARIPTLTELDAETALLVRVAAVVAGGTESQVHHQLAEAAQGGRHRWIEEVLLQTYLFAGFPRALNAMREWRTLTGRVAPPTDEQAVGALEARRQAGHATCAQVYGTLYDRLRVTVAALHPSLEEWMLEEGYGKVLSRPALDLPRRELCIVAACAMTGQDRQLHSHLLGALNVGVAPDAVVATLREVGTLVDSETAVRHRALWTRVARSWSGGAP